ncbi:hemerythrin domain-containing protein [Aminobacter sp. Piv2-1]|uniref:hemerythrin domain-containing protein n=1 Tax=Aminobacter sp. Piv2-1 TaxID=3031122 RepID=UPI0030A6970B
MRSRREMKVGTEQTALTEAIAAVRRAHAAKLILCDRLEAIADSLPGGLDRRECLLAARALGPEMIKVHRFEEQHVYPHFVARLLQSAEARKTIARLKSEHCEDEGYAAELRDALRATARRGRAENPETLGFMLRGFFGALRRHIAFERDHVMAQIVPDCVTPD